MVQCLLSCKKTMGGFVLCFDSNSCGRFIGLFVALGLLKKKSARAPRDKKRLKKKRLANDSKKWP